MLKRTFMLLVASLPALAYSEDTANSDDQYCCPLLPPEPVDSCQLPTGIFYPAEYTLQGDGMNISVGGEFIYWVFARDGGLSSLGNRFRVVGNETNVEELFHRPGYRSGFRVAVGMGLPGCDNVVANIEYTWFHHTTTNNFRAAAGEVLGPRFFPPGFFGTNALRSQFKGHLDFIQATAGRPFYISQRFIASAGIGLKAWWTLQEENLFFTSPNGLPATQLSKSGAWGIGPYFATTVKGLLWCGLYLTGKAGLWPTYTEFTKHRIQTNFPPVPAFGFPGFVNLEKNSDKPYIAQLFYETGAGLGWATYLCNCSYHVDVAVIYEYINSFILDTLFSNGLPSREAFIQGLSVRAAFTF